MSVFPTKATPARRRTFTTYLALWMAAAGLAASYLAYLGINPDVIPGPAPDGHMMQEQIAQTQRHVERAVADFEPVRESVGSMKMEVATLKTEVQAAGERDRMILEKVAALEQTITPPKVAKAGATAKTASPPKPAKKAAAKSKNVAAASTSRKIETGSIKKKAAPKRAPSGVLLATGPSVDTLRLNWSILTDRHADTMRNLQPRYVISGSGANRSYALVAGPLPSPTKAKELCTIMAAKGLACQVSSYRGNAL